MPRARIDIRVDESAGCGVVVTGLQIIEAGFGIVVIAAITQRIGAGHAAGLRENVAPCVVGIGSVDCFRQANEIPVGVPRRQGAENLNHVALLVQRIEVCYVAAAIVSGILDCKGAALCIVGEDHDLGRAVCVSMLFLALKISLIWFYQKCCKQRKCMCMIQNIAGSRK